MEMNHLFNKINNERSKEKYNFVKGDMNSMMKASKDDDKNSKKKKQAFDEELNELKSLLDESAAYSELLMEAEGYGNQAKDMAPPGHAWVYVVLFNAKLVTTKVIRHFTKDPYNHTSISFDKSLTKMYSFARGGFNIETIRGTYKDDATFSVYKIAVPLNAVIVMKDAIANIQSLKHEYKYSVLGLLGFIFTKHQAKFNTREKAMFCSQFAAKMFATAGMKIFNKENYEVKPYDFAKNKNFKFCYRGTVKHFDQSRIR